MVAVVPITAMVAVVPIAAIAAIVAVVPIAEAVLVAIRHHYFPVRLSIGPTSYFF